jgi:hypothetical protein
MTETTEKVHSVRTETSTFRAPQRPSPTRSGQQGHWRGVSRSAGERQHRG